MAAPSPTFGELLQKHLDRAGMTQAELARRLHVDRTTVNHWLNDRRTPDTKEIVAKIARILRIDDRQDRVALTDAAGYELSDPIAPAAPAAGVINAAAATEEVRPDGSQAEPPWRVPFLRNEAFVGREKDLDNLHAALASSTTVGIRSAVPGSAAGLTGMGGIGKTQLAVEYCYRYRDAYPGGIFWLNAAGADWREEFADLGTYLAPDLAGEPPTRRIRVVADYLNTHADSLVVLDNVADPAQMRHPVTPDLVPANLRCRILLTTRSRHLGAIQPVEVTVLPPAPALHLLLRHPTRQLLSDPTHPEHAEAQRICAILGNLPLALEIAGSHLGKRPQLSPAAYCRELLTRGALRIIDDPRTGVRDVDLGTRHQAAVAATLSGQWEALENEDARLLLRVAGQLPEAAAIPVARLGLMAGLPADGDIVFGSPLDNALAELGRLSLIERLAGDELRLHPLVREFAQSQTLEVDPQCFRRTCALNLLGAYQDVAELERQCAQRGVDALEADVRATLQLLPNTADVQPFTTMLQQLLRMLQHESHILRGWNPTQQPALFLQQWRKRTLVSRDPQGAKAAAEALTRLRVPHLDLLWTTGAESVGLERTLSGHMGVVKAVALWADGQRAVSASWDGTLKVWDLASGVELHTFCGHKSLMKAVAVTPDGQRAVSASNDRTLKVWDLASGVELHTLCGHTDQVNSVAVTADGQRAVSASNDRTLKVWDLASGTELHTLNGHTSLVNAVAVTPDGQRAVSTSNDRTLKVWDLGHGEELHTLSGHKSLVNAVAITADGQRAVSASGDHTLKVWDLTSGAELHTLSGHMIWVSAVAVTADGQRAVSASYDNTLKVWDLARGTELHTLNGHTSVVNAVAVTADGQRAVSASWDRTLKVWDLASGVELHTLSGHTNLMNAVVVTANGQRAVSASDDHTLKIWDLARGAKLRNLSGHTDHVRAVAVTADGQRAVSASNDRTLKVWDLASGVELHTLRGHTSLVRAVAVTADAQRAVSASWDGTLKVWDLASGVELHTLRGHTDQVTAVAVTSDGQRAVSASNDNTLKVWDLASGAELHTLSGHKIWVRAVAVTPDGQRAVSASMDNTLKVWDLASGAELHTLSGHTDLVEDVAVTADGERAVSASGDNTLKVWDLASGVELHILSGHMRPPLAVVVTADGRRAVSASNDRTLKVWDLASGVELHTLSGHTSVVNSVSVTADGQRAVSGSNDHSLKVWDLAAACEVAGLTLDASIECIQFTSDNITIIIGDALGNVHCLRYCDPRPPATAGS